MTKQYTNGVAYVLYAKGKDGEMLRIAGQTDASLALEGNLTSITNKDDFGWSSDIQGAKSFSISTTSLLALSDEGHELLEEAFMNGTNLPIEVRTPSKTKWSGQIKVASLSYDLGAEDVAQYSAELVGQGALKRIEQTEEEEEPENVEQTEEEEPENGDNGED